MTVPVSQLHALPTLQKNTPLAPFTTFRLGGPARYLVVAHDIDTMIRAALAARAEHVPLVILGSGSNVLVAASGFPGLVIIVATMKLIIAPPTITAEAGVKLSVLLVRAAQAGLGGLTCLAGVPGTVGGAIVGNAGSRTEAIGDRIAHVDVLTADGRRRRVGKADCDFAYRTSRFKSSGDIILSAELQLVPGDPAVISREQQALIRQKNVKQPTAAQSAGCMFKNVPVPDPSVLPEALRSGVVDGQLPAWRLIAAAGMQGAHVGGVRISDRHANFMLNDGTATVDHVCILLSRVKQRVRDRFSLQLQEEVRLIGFDSIPDPAAHASLRKTSSSGTLLAL